MYIVRWCDHEGNLCERTFQKYLDARAEAKHLDNFYDGVEIVTPSGNRIWPLDWATQ